VAIFGAGVLGPALALGASGTRAVSRSFSVPVPAGFESNSEPEQRPIYDGGGLVLAEEERPRFEHAIQASIVISPLPNKGLDLKDPILCFSIGDNAAKSLQGTVLGVKQIKRPIGPACQVLIQPKRDKRREPEKLARAEVVGGSAQLWMVTCHFDRRDVRAQNSCDEVLNGFQPTVPIEPR
jgi:hypothetical protein